MGCFILFKGANYLIICFTLLLFLLIISPSVFAADNSTDIACKEDLLSLEPVEYYFDINADEDGDGSISNPYKDFKPKISYDNTIIHLANGEYNFNPSKTYRNITFLGNDADKTIINGFDSSLSIKGVILKNLTVTKLTINNLGKLNASNVIFTGSSGYIDEDYGHIFGGAIYSSLNKYNVYLNNCTFTNNNADYGGAIYICGGVLQAYDCQFINNTAYSYGGAIAGNPYNNYKPQIRLKNSKFINDTSLHNAGGAIYLKMSTFDAEGINFTSCSAVMGGAVSLLNTTSSLKNIYAFNNTAGYDGGVIYQIYAKLDISNSKFLNNYAYNGGALFVDSLTSANIINNDFINNKAKYYAGGIYSIFNKFKITNNNYNNNSAAFSNDIFEDAQPSLIISSGNYSQYHYNFNSTALPSYYNSADLGYVTSIKNQLDGGNCWAFAPLATLESCILKAGGPSLDLSEENMKNIASLYSRYGWNFDTNEGGYDDQALGYLVSWLGPVLEKSDVYDPISVLSPAMNGIMHVQNVKYLKRNSISDNDGIKRAIMDYGAVSTSLYMDAKYIRSIDAYGQCYRGSYDSDHAVVLVGWDDNIVLGRNYRGAWIVKNSWGSDWGDDGYFYVSYYDVSCMPAGDDASAFTFILNDTIKFDKNYQYDIANSNFLSSYQDTVWYKNIFTATDNEFLAAVSTYFEFDTNWEFSVYVNNVLKQTKSGFSNPGYYTLNLNKIIPLKVGDVFEVVFKIKTSSMANVPVSEAFFFNNMYNSKKISYISFDGNNWEDLYDYDEGYDSYYIDQKVACIKAFTILSPIDTFLNLQIDYNEYNPVTINAFILNKEGLIINSGYVLFNLSGYMQRVDVKDGVASITHNFKRGDNDISAVFISDEFTSSYNSTTINVKKIDVDMYLNQATVNLDSILFNISISQPINESIIITIGDKNYSKKTNDGKLLFNVSGLDYGVNEFKIHLYDAVYIAHDIEDFRFIQVKRTQIILNELNTSQNSGVDYIIYLKDIYGNLLNNKSLEINIGGEIFNSTTDNGKISVNINLFKGNYPVFVKFKGDDTYLPTESASSIHIDSSIILANKVYATNSNLKLRVLNKYLNPLANGKVKITLNGILYEVISDANGYVSFNINLESGIYSLNVVNTQTGDVLNQNIEVVKRITQNTDLNVYYTAKTTYKVRVCDDNGNFAGGIPVSIKVGGKTYNVFSDSNGYAFISLNLKPAFYNVEVECRGYKVFNKINVKSTIITKNIKVKKSKPIKFSAKILNSDGKILKNKKIKFKFMKKSYKVKTNKKGKAVLKIKNNYKSGNYKIYTKYGALKVKNNIRIY